MAECDEVFGDFLGTADVVGYDAGKAGALDEATDGQRGDSAQLGHGLFGVTAENEGRVDSTVLYDHGDFIVEGVFDEGLGVEPLALLLKHVDD